MPACLNCGYQSNFLLKCGGCREVRYCGVTCQEECWNKHQKECIRKMEFRKNKARMLEKSSLDNEVD